MRPNWREVPRDRLRTQWAGMHVTLNPKGWIALSRVTWEKIGGPKAFLLLFDDVNNRIGLKPAALTARNAYPALVNSPFGSKRIYAGRLMKECRVSLPMTVRFYDADTNEDGILILDLRTARVLPRAETMKRKANGE